MLEAGGVAGGVDGGVAGGVDGGVLGGGDAGACREYEPPFRLLKTSVFVDELNACELFSIVTVPVPAERTLNVTWLTSLSPDTGVVVPRSISTAPPPPVLLASIPKALPEPSIDTNCKLEL